MANNDDYEVGFRRPPKSTRFKPGQSGNPLGRPKAAPTLRADLDLELREMTVVGEGERKISKQRALVKALVDAAIGGDVRAATAIIGLSKGLGGHSYGEEQASSTSEDAELVEEFLERQLSRRTSEADGAPEMKEPTAPQEDNDNE